MSFCGIRMASLFRMGIFLPVIITRMPAWAVDAPMPPFAGVWHGVIGNSKVQVCFNGSYSQYYYLKHLRGIGLVADDDVADFSAWNEKIFDGFGWDAVAKTSGKWKIAETEKGVLQGTWTSPGGDKSLEIKLSKAAELNEQGTLPCGPAFYRPIESAMRYTRKPARFQGIAYEEIKTETGDAFELPATLAGAPEFNAFVHSWLREQAANAFDCRVNGGRDWGRALAPLIWTGRFLVVADNLPATFCGGTQGDWSHESLVFDLQTGKRINTWNWIKGGEGSVADLDKSEKKPRLRALIEKLNPSPQKTPGCEEEKDRFSVSQPYPTERGWD